MILRGLYGVWIIGCVACLIAFMSVFFFSRKTVFKSLLDTYSTPSGSIEKVLVSSLAFQQLGRSIELLCLIWWVVPRHLLDTFICRRPFSQHLPRQLAQYLSTPTPVEIYWWPLYSPHAIRSSFLSISLEIPLSFQLPNTHSNLLP